MNNNKADPPVDYDLTCWYLNARRIMELIGTRSIERFLQGANGVDAVGDIYRKNAIIANLKQGMTEWLNREKPPTLGQLLQEGGIREGKFFTHYTNFFFRGLNKVSKALETGKSPPMADGYAKLDELAPGKKLTFKFHHEHLTSSSAWGNLSGQKRMLFVGTITETKDDEIGALPWVIANPMPDVFRPQTIIGSHWHNRLEVHVDEIDNFGNLRDYQPRYRGADLDLLKAIPENDVKAAIADLIGETNIPKDWAGERSDLFSQNVRLSGNAIAAAFAFKGPAKFHPMTLADLGKNGDQINRLFSEPAELLVLQHCHEITPPVRGMMRAFAQQFGNLRLFCIIDGFATLRVLEANNRCGLSRRNLPARPEHSHAETFDDES
jgi:hypothetical protein